MTMMVKLGSEHNVLIGHINGECKRSLGLFQYL